VKRSVCVLAFVIFFGLSAVVFAGSFKVYPGAKLEDVYEIKEAKPTPQMQKTPKVLIFTTNDFFENVVAFYRGAGREYRIPGGGVNVTKLQTGQELKETYFIFDDAPDIMSSKHWIKIQRPYLVRGRTEKGFQGRYEAIRNVTAIIEEDKRRYP